VESKFRKTKHENIRGQLGKRNRMGQREGRPERRMRR
jgi:hypothetical protein